MNHCNPTLDTMKPIVFVLLIISCLLFTTSFSYAQYRGMKPVQINIEGVSTTLYTQSHALLIGINAYNSGLPPLPGVVQDINIVKAALETNGFNVVTVMNPDNAGLQRAFTSFIAKYGQGFNNRLLIYFAGHGYTEKMPWGDNIGYLCPVNVPNPNIDPVGFQETAIPMRQIEMYAYQIKAKHALFMFDACFSGSIFALSRAIPEVIDYKTKEPVRQFIASGSADETVLDKSIFRDQFIRALQGEADGNKDGYLTGTELGEFLQDKVTNYSYGAQHPQYGKIRNPNLDKGDFVFILDHVSQYDSVANTNATFQTLGRDEIKPIKYQNGVNDNSDYKSKNNVSNPSSTLSFYELTKRGNTVFIDCNEPKVEKFIFQYLKGWDYWKIIEKKDYADFILKFAVDKKALGERKAFVQFIDPKSNIVIKTTDDVDTFWSMTFRTNKKVIEKIFRKRIKPLFQ